MAKDSYIDISEVMRYGEHFVAAAGDLVGLDSAVNVQVLIDGQAAFVEEFRGQLSKADSSKSDLSDLEQKRRGYSEDVATQLGLFYNFLVPLNDTGEVSLSRFFADGKKSSIGRSHADRSRAIQRCVESFGAYPELGALEPWKEKLSGLAADFSAALDAASNVNSSKVSTSKDFQRVKKAWWKDYQACKHMIRGLLARLDRSDEFRSYFLDLQ